MAWVLPTWLWPLPPWLWPRNVSATPNGLQRLGRVFHWALVGIAALLAATAAISLIIAAGSILPGSVSIITGRPTVPPPMMDSTDFKHALEWNRQAEAGELSPADRAYFDREVAKPQEMARRVWENGVQRALEALWATLALLAGALSLVLIGRAIRYVFSGE